MGYRKYIGSLPKSEWEEIKDLTLDELFKYKKIDIQDDCLSVFNIAYNEMYGFGDTDFDGEGKPVFSNTETQKYFDDEHHFKIVDKEFLAKIIEHYQNKITSMYTDMLEPFKLLCREKSEFLESIETVYDGNRFNTKFDFTKITQDEVNSLYKMIEHVRLMGSEHGANRHGFMNDVKPYELDDRDSITTSWKFEYVQFELVRLYKHFDWDNNVVIFYGY